MSKKLGIIWNYLAHYKYLIVIVTGVLVVGVVDDNSVRQHIKYQIGGRLAPFGDRKVS